MRSRWVLLVTAMLVYVAGAVAMLVWG